MIHIPKGVALLSAGLFILYQIILSSTNLFHILIAFMDLLLLGYFLITAVSVSLYMVFSLTIICYAYTGEFVELGKMLSKELLKHRTSLADESRMRIVSPSDGLRMRIILLSDDELHMRRTSLSNETSRMRKVAQFYLTEHAHLLRTFEQCNRLLISKGCLTFLLCHTSFNVYLINMFALQLHLDLILLSALINSIITQLIIGMVTGVLLVKISNSIHFSQKFLVGFQAKFSGNKFIKLKCKIDRHYELLNGSERRFGVTAGPLGTVTMRSLFQVKMGCGIHKRRNSYFFSM